MRLQRRAGAALKLRPALLEAQEAGQRVPVLLSLLLGREWEGLLTPGAEELEPAPAPKPGSAEANHLVWLRVVPSYACACALGLALAARRVRAACDK